MEELAAVFLTERHRFSNGNGDVIVGYAHPNEGGERFTIKGPADVDELESRLSYRFYGRWSQYKNKRTGVSEKQFHFKTFIRMQPHGRDGIIRYLMNAPHVGIAIARKLWSEFGSDAVRIVREQPGLASTTIGSYFSPYKAEEAAAWLESEKDLEDCAIDLIELLGSRGFPKTTTKKAIKLWGNRAAEFIRRNPYILMQFRGCGFKRCDAMYLDLGLPPGRLKRQALCAWYSLASSSEGHTWFPVEVAVAGIRADVGLLSANVRPVEALKLAKRAGMIATMRTDGVKGGIIKSGGRLWLAEGKKANHELFIAEHLHNARYKSSNWPYFDISDLGELSDHQQDKLTTTTTNIIGILGGSPGTGKSYSAAALARLIVDEHGADCIAVCAPTGKAAVRMTEVMAESGLPLRATTIHSLLGVMEAKDRRGWSFEHGELNPLDIQFLIVDESSMIDTDLMASLLSARSVGMHILFVGDINQLPPVGHGAPLRDMIAAGVPYGELREIRRNSGMIVEACANIRDGKSFSGCRTVDIDAGLNLKIVESHPAERQIEKMFHAIDVASHQGLDPVWDVQVLVPVNRKSKLARKELNTLLQLKLNRNLQVSGSPFRVGDKIVNTKNGYFPALELDVDSEDLQSNDRDEVYVANGELARVIEVGEKFTVAKLENPNRTIRIPRSNQQEASRDDSNSDDTGTGCSWDLGYALSVHKFQGSEIPIAIIMIDEYPGARRVCSREWIYTAISRAKRLCLLIGKRSTAMGFCRRTALTQRKTFLCELMQTKSEKMRT